jgi:crossover junction endodeoxyribonuclease RuvC
MIVLGIDLSLTGTGLSVVEGDRLLFSECYKPKNKSGPTRLIEIRHKVSETIDKYQPELICIEGYSFGSRGRALFQIGELGGLIRVLLHKTGIKWLEITPSQVKKFAAGVGNCGKDIIMQQVYKRWGMEFKTSDEADAFILAKIGTILLGHKEKLIKAQEEVIDALEGDRK